MYADDIDPSVRRYRYLHALEHECVPQEPGKDISYPASWKVRARGNRHTERDRRGLMMWIDDRIFGGFISLIELESVNEMDTTFVFFHASVSLSSLHRSRSDRKRFHPLRSHHD